MMRLEWNVAVAGGDEVPAAPDVAEAEVAREHAVATVEVALGFLDMHVDRCGRRTRVMNSTGSRNCQIMWLGSKLSPNPSRLSIASSVRWVVQKS